MKKLWFVSASAEVDFLAWGDTAQDACYEFESLDIDPWDVSAREMPLASVPQYMLKDEIVGDQGDPEIEELTVEDVNALLKQRKDAEPLVDTQTAPLPFPEARP